MIFCLAPDEIDKYWDDFKDHLYRFERLGEINVNECRGDLRASKRQLWGYQKDGRVLGVVLTRIAGPKCEICGAVGSATKDEIRETYAAIERWAREIGCTHMKVNGRKGWLRVLDGFKQTGIQAEKEL